MRSIIVLLFSILSFSTSLSQSNSCNCCSENHRAFDFWVGTWEVSNADGTTAGKNVIDKIQDSCILRENWVSAKEKYTGTSSNFYNSQTKQWEQLWIDNQGLSLHLKGNRKGNQMILESDQLKNKEGKLYRNRITWTLNKDGSVRQLWEIIQNGKTISISFDGLYKKLKD